MRRARRCSAAETGRCWARTARVLSKAMASAAAVVAATLVYLDDCGRGLTAGPRGNHKWRIGWSFPCCGNSPPADRRVGRCPTAQLADGRTCASLNAMVGHAASLVVVDTPRVGIAAAWPELRGAPWLLRSMPLPWLWRSAAAHGHRTAARALAWLWRFRARPWFPEPVPFAIIRRAPRCPMVRHNVTPWIWLSVCAPEEGRFEYEDVRRRQ